MSENDINFGPEQTPIEKGRYFFMERNCDDRLILSVQP